MNTTPLALVVEADDLQQHLGEDRLVVVDLSKPETYLQSHVPGAVHLEYPRIIDIRKPVMGLVPEAPVLATVLGNLGITPETHVVAYDDEGGGKACRLLWTLATLGHQGYSLLNGGLHAWVNEGHALEGGSVAPTPAAAYPIPETRQDSVDYRYIQTHLGEAGIALLDTRSVEEYHGIKCFAARGGHIPGAVNLDWMQTMDQTRNLRFKPEGWLRETLQGLGVTPDKEVIVYCQSHHRSAHTYIMLKHLGYARVSGYPGSWSDWGNREDTPVEI